MRKKSYRSTLTAEELQRVLSYEPETGIFRWRTTRGWRRAGKEAGSLNERGYRLISVGNVKYLAHRLAWLYMTGDWPAGDVDHRDADPSNNSWANLRLATPQQNSANSRRPATNTSGYKGAWFHRRAGRWCAHIRVNGKSRHLGLFDTPEEAHAAYCAAAALHFGAYARAA